MAQRSTHPRRGCLPRRGFVISSVVVLACVGIVAAGCNSNPSTAVAYAGFASPLVVLITYATTEDAVRRALAAVQRDGVLTETPQMIRIEKS